MEFILTSLLAFVSTNIDDIFLLMLFFGIQNFKRDRLSLANSLESQC